MSNEIPWSILAIAGAAAMWCVVFLAQHAHGAEADGLFTTGDPGRGAWFQSLNRNDTHTSCCDVSDCRHVAARQRADGIWEAKATMPKEGWPSQAQFAADGWVVIPAEIVLQRPLSIDGEAYLCMTYVQMYCFIPPIPGF